MRDSVMAENYLTLTGNLFSKEKVIVWGHNAHLSKKSMDKEYKKSMGEFLSQKSNSMQLDYMLMVVPMVWFRI